MVPNTPGDMFTYTIEATPKGGLVYQFHRVSEPEAQIPTPLFLVGFENEEPAEFTLSFVSEAFGSREPIIPPALLDAFFWPKKLGAVAPQKRARRAAHSELCPLFCRITAPHRRPFLTGFTRCYIISLTIYTFRLLPVQKEHTAHNDDDGSCSPHPAPEKAKHKTYRHSPPRFARGRAVPCLHFGRAVPNRPRHLYAGRLSAQPCPPPSKKATPHSGGIKLTPASRLVALLLALQFALIFINAFFAPLPLAVVQA